MAAKMISFNKNGFKYDIEDEIFKGFKFRERVKKKDLNLVGK
jgi:hypothetical protein